jgi:hypothetical protein
MDRRIDVVLALGVVALGVFIVVAAQFIGKSPIADPIGPRGIPTGLGIAFALGGAGLVARRVIRWRTEDTVVVPEGTQDDAGVPPGSARRALKIWVAGAVYILTLPWAGYLIGTPLFVGVILNLLKFDRERLFGVIPAAVAFAVAFTAITYAVFAMVLGIRLPLGVVRELYLMLTGR